MTFAQEIIEGAAALILVDEESEGLEGGDSLHLMRILNDYCAELFQAGYDFGYRPVSNVADLITCPPSVNAALKYNVAMRSNPIFGLPVPPEVSKYARETEKTLKGNFVKPMRGRLPPGLPMGSGRVNGYSFYGFAEPVAHLRLATAQTVSIAAAETPVQVGGWTVDQSINITALPAGSIEYTGGDAYLAMIKASFTVSASGGDELSFYFAKNGAIIPQSRIPFNSDVAQNILMDWPETLRRGDTITLMAENKDDTTDIELSNGHFYLT